MRVGLALMAAALLAGEAQAADQFDLVCKGDVRTSIYSKKRAPYQARYRIDLAQKLWCMNECSGVHHLADITPSRISFEDKEDPLKHRTIYHYVERGNGAWTDYDSDLGPYPSVFDVKGVCDPAPFSGIDPQTKF